MANHRRQPSSSVGSFVSLADIDPDLLRDLTESERAEATRVLLPVRDVPDRAFELAELLGNSGAFGAVVLEGMLQHHMRIGEQPGLRVLGPGEIVGAGAAPRPMMLAASAWRAAGGTRLALLTEDFLFAIRRWPGLFASLQSRVAEQTERLTTQLAICQLPRVEDRLLAMLWLLAESWGRVTSAGTTLPLSLTHEALGALIGARRPTVTLALGELAERGAVVHQDRGWLLVEAFPEAAGEGRDIDAPSVLDDPPSDWAQPEPPPQDRDGEARAALVATVRRLRAEHERNREEIQELVRRIMIARARSQQLRDLVRQERLLRQQAPLRPPSS